MSNLKELQRRIIANRVRRGWPSAHDLSKTKKGLREECLEFQDALREKDVAAMVDALGDIMVFCLGGFEILGVDGLEVVTEIVNKNDAREYGPDDHH